MFITITTSKVTPEQAKLVEEFLKGFSPRFRKQPGVMAIYHYARPEKGDESTVVIWESPEAVKAYRESDLIKEAIAFETPAQPTGHKRGLSARLRDKRGNG